MSIARWRSSAHCSDHELLARMLVRHEGSAGGTATVGLQGGPRAAWAATRPVEDRAPERPIALRQLAQADPVNAIVDG